MTLHITRAAVVGAGTMGHGIAHALAASQIAVELFDGKEGAAAAGRAAIQKNLEKGVSLGKVTADDAAAILARVTVATSLPDAARAADLVVEAVPEVMAIKRQVFQEVAAVAPSHALLATNTSSLSIAEIASATDTPARVIGLHFFNPVHLMKLVEVVRHAQSSDDVVAAATTLVARMGKSPIVVRDSPGFASSRLGLVLGLEAMRMVEEGVASAADIDTAMKLGYGHPMGPLELTDLVGLDVRLGIAEYLTRALGPGFTPPKILRDKVSAGALGKKSGRGFFEWDDAGKRRG